MPRPLRRRDLLIGGASILAAGALQGCTAGGRRTWGQAPAADRLEFLPLRATTDRITQITVCTRPFRAQGPCLDVQKIGDKIVIHNYGHGGSGWSLSWGSSNIAVQKALETNTRDVAVIGCGALGMTSALLLQRAGIRTTIYAKELPPNVRSSFATGVWSPDSRICLEQNLTPSFKQQWERMTRKSFQTYQTLLGLPGDPVEFIDSYTVSDEPIGNAQENTPKGGRPPFAELQRELVPDLIPRPKDYAPGSHSLNNRYLEGTTSMMFNLAAYSRMLLADFRSNGGSIEIAEFHGPGDLASLSQKTLINATGYGARALFGDLSVTPVRGQVARLIPQPEIHYGLYYKNAYFAPRRDGFVFQLTGEDDYYGFDDPTTVPDRAEAEAAVNTIAELFPAA